MCIYEGQLVFMKGTCIYEGTCFFEGNLYEYLWRAIVALVAVVAAVAVVAVVALVAVELHSPGNAGGISRRLINNNISVYFSNYIFIILNIQWVKQSRYPQNIPSS